MCAYSNKHVIAAIDALMVRSVFIVVVGLRLFLAVFKTLRQRNAHNIEQYSFFTVKMFIANGCRLHFETFKIFVQIKPYVFIIVLVFSLLNQQVGAVLRKCRCVEEV